MAKIRTGERLKFYLDCGVQGYYFLGQAHLLDKKTTIK
jgi:hypothetical protein